MTSQISAHDLRSVDLTAGVIIDVRTPMEHHEKRLTCAHTHIPLDQLDPRAFMEQNNLPSDTPVYLLCRSGGRATQAAAKFISAGYPNVSVIAGGIMACETCGHDIIGTAVPSPGPTGRCGPPSLTDGFFTIRRPITLERQVRITAGALVLAGLLGTVLIHPAFIGITAFVGAGLLYAGLTDRCGMALILARAPWNSNFPPLPTGEGGTHHTEAR